VEEAYARGVRKLVHTSSVAVLRQAVPGRAIDESMPRPADGEKDDYYRSKILSDQAVVELLEKRPDLWACFVLPGFMNGPGDAGPTSAGQFVLDYLHGRLPGALDATFSYVDARDVAAAMVRAVERGRRGEKYLVAGRSLHVREAMAALAEISGIPAPTRTLSMPLLGAIAFFNEAWARVSGQPVLVSWAGYRTLSREREAMDFDSSKASRELDVTFRPLRETFADAIAWFSREGLVAARAAEPDARRPSCARSPLA
jgi:nucleoside-diphosphate-sugar epimerase